MTQYNLDETQLKELTNTPTINQPAPSEDGQKATSEGYERALTDLMINQGYSRGKARRYLDSIAKKRVKKFMKNQKKKASKIN